VGITFHTPEEYFHDEAPQSYTRDFDPSTYLHPVSSTSTDTSKSNKFNKEYTKTGSAPIIIEKKNPRDIVLFCGSPASGKSTFYWQSLRPLGYERVNQDLLKTVNALHKSLYFSQVNSQ
jgi:bifunctional polynucleotide phosphatase/kinase